MENIFQDFDEIEFQKMIKISDSLSFDDVKQDSDYLFNLIKKHHPDGKFSLLENVNVNMNNENKNDDLIGFQFPQFIIEFNQHLINKYNDRIYANAVSRKVFRVFF